MFRKKQRKTPREKRDDAIMYELLQINLYMSRLLIWSLSQNEEVEKYCPGYMHMLKAHTESIRELSEQYFGKS